MRAARSHTRHPDFGYPMDDPIPYEGRCNALTRARTPCRRVPSPGRRRCNLHGGKSPRGSRHPRFKHGLYSRYTYQGRERLREAEQRRRERA